jgi:hypothetical protein
VILAPPSPLPSDSDANVSAYVNRIWPHIEGHVNRLVPHHSRLLRPLVLVMSSTKTFLVSDKGTVKGAATVALYRKEIDKAYDNLESGRMETSVDFPVEHDEASVAIFTQAIVCDTLGHDVPSNVDLFSLGLDSLLAMKLRASATAALRHAGLRSDLPVNIVYANPTRNLLSKYLFEFAAGLPNGVDPNSNIESVIDGMVYRLMQDLPEQLDDKGGDVYAVTGTTGSLGSAFLEHILQQPEIRRVYLLNRPNTSVSMTERHAKFFKDRGLDWSTLEDALASGRAVFLDIDIGEPRFGLSPQAYAKVCIPNAVAHVARTLITAHTRS